MMICLERSVVLVIENSGTGDIITNTTLLSKQIIVIKCFYAILTGFFIAAIAEKTKDTCSQRTARIISVRFISNTKPFYTKRLDRCNLFIIYSPQKNSKFIGTRINHIFDLIGINS